jgi:hypothetical protein
LDWKSQGNPEPVVINKKIRKPVQLNRDYTVQRRYFFCTEKRVLSKCRDFVAYPMKKEEVG